ncbi:MAG TPA: helicase C-terminal domain-containing protein [Verrucomicrobiae bacterium]|nr:helicase C-terminal domain-containing protein [Verrucomicrobiae bacterium]
MAFVLRSGDLGGAGHFATANRALEGTRGHQRLQKQRPPGYEPEVAISWRSEAKDFIFELKGRIDGVLPRDGTLLIEEIKTVSQPWIGPADPLHLAQAKIYAFLCAEQRGFKAAAVRITYLELESGETVEFGERFEIDGLKEFFDGVIAEYLQWIREHLRWQRERDLSIEQLAFPFQSYRSGQRALAVAVYRTIKARGKLFAEAPTGIGKTISVVFPAIKAMGEQRVEKIFYLTAKTIGRAVAEKTIADLRLAGLRLRSVTITAKEKVCFNSGRPCDLRTCPFALGYYDRIKTAIRDALQNERFTRSDLEEIARRHQVCPFELSLDLSLWVDLVICDYNYAFDPTASLKRYFDDEKHDYAVLIDEAHNLVDRAREMFSAELAKDQLISVRKEIEDALPGCAKALTRIENQLTKLHKDEGFVPREGAFVSKAAPEKIKRPLKLFMESAEAWLARNEQAAFRQRLLEIYFKLLGFDRVLEFYDEPYIAIYEKDAGRLRLFCADPSDLLRKALEHTGAAIFFSATLTPMEYFRESLGGEMLDPTLRFDSPFPPENLKVLVQNRVATRLNARALSYDAVAECIGALVAAKTGNYLVYFPSYEYLRQVLERFRTRFPDLATEAQTFGMKEVEREQFIAKFRNDAERTHVAFTVLGGIFGEGIDLVGDRLIGVVVVGVGLPQICLERDLIREQVQQLGRAGFDYAYTFPGMNRVLQAAGRVIRSETDRGVVLLIDERFRQPQYRKLLPAWWATQQARSPDEIHSAAREFWSDQKAEARSLDALVASSKEVLEKSSL